MPLKHSPVRLAIVGGGAAGMFAAAIAAERGVSSLVIERKARLGSKVLMTANGRCNFTRDRSADEFLADLETPGAAAKAFLTPAIRACPPRQLVQGFRSLGVSVRRMADGRMFPADGKAATIVHAFGDLLRDQGVPVLVNCPVTAIQPQKHGFIVATGNFTLWAENVLLATGGLSYPKTGSVGDGQNFAHALGHRIVPCRAGLIGLETDDPKVVRLRGRRFEDGRTRLIASDSRVVFDYAGEVDCESFGLSGAAVYNAQRYLAHLEPRQADELKLEVWFDRNRLTYQALRARPLKEAIVTIGGVALDEVDARTMESKKVPHLYFAGEVLDVDGPTGGYNLTIAFATARAAVTAVASQPENRRPS